VELRRTVTFTQCTLLTTQLHKTTTNHNLHTQAEHHMHFHTVHSSQRSSTRPQPTTTYTPRQNTTCTFTQRTLLTMQLHKTTTNHNLHTQAEHHMHFHTVHTAHDAAPQDYSQPQPTHPGRTPHALSHNAHCSQRSSTRPQPTTAYTPRQNTTCTFTQCTLLTMQLHKTTANHSLHTQAEHHMHFHTLHTAHNAAPQDHSQPQPTHPGRTPHALSHSAH